MQQKSRIMGGFTLIELLVVVIIIAILAAVALPQYQKVIDKANFLRADAVARELVRQLELYYEEHGSYPTNYKNIGFSWPGCTVPGNVTCDDIKFAGEPIQLIPSNDKQFIYFTTSNSFRNYYYFIHTEQEHRGEWKCGATGGGRRGGRLCKSICGASSCYYK